MNGYFISNAVGWWALLGIPAVLLIHFLQQKRKPRPVSTLFLLDHLEPESVGGRSWQRLRASAALFLQLLAVLVLTWMLLQPRQIVETSSGRVVLVLDSSVSMQAFRDGALAAVERQIGLWQSLDPHVEWVLLETKEGGRRLYRGADAGELRAALAAWEPWSGGHAFGPAFELAGRQVAKGGPVLFITDHAGPGVPGITMLSVGRPMTNAGWAGSEVKQDKDGWKWSALIRNYGNAPIRRRWFVQTGQEKAEAGVLQLEPGTVQRLTGSFPPGASRMALVLEPDEFAPDDVLPLVLPVPKPLTVTILPDDKIRDWMERIVTSLPGGKTEKGGRASDIDVTYLEEQRSGRGSGALIFIGKGKAAERQGILVSEEHPYVQNLVWQGLLTEGPLHLDEGRNVRTLVWSGGRPLIFLEEADGVERLFFNFDVARSNALRLPACSLLVRRYLQTIQQMKPVPERANVDAGQMLGRIGEQAGEPLQLDMETPGGSKRTEDADPLGARAPELPSFFTLHQKKEIRMEGAAQFAAMGEAGFLDAMPVDESGQAWKRQLERRTIPDPFLSWWLLVLGMLMAASWWFSISPAFSRRVAEGGAK